MDKVIIYQFFVLLLGTLFAWGNFIYEFIAWRKGKVCVTCVANGKVVNPFLTPCFYGAIFFTIAFVLSAILFVNY